MSDSGARARAWATRRRLYGAAGHRGSYSGHGALRCRDCERMIGVIVRLYAEGVLSEGQAAKATGRDRVWLRIARDEIINDHGVCREEG